MLKMVVEVLYLTDPSPFHSLLFINLLHFLLLSILGAGEEGILEQTIYMAF